MGPCRSVFIMNRRHFRKLHNSWSDCKCSKNIILQHVLDLSEISISLSWFISGIRLRENMDDHPRPYHQWYKDDVGRRNIFMTARTQAERLWCSMIEEKSQETRNPPLTSGPIAEPIAGVFASELFIFDFLLCFLVFVFQNWCWSLRHNRSTSRDVTKLLLCSGWERKKYACLMGYRQTLHIMYYFSKRFDDSKLLWSPFEVGEVQKREKRNVKIL